MFGFHPRPAVQLYLPGLVADARQKMIVRSSFAVFHELDLRRRLNLSSVIESVVLDLCGVMPLRRFHWSGEM